MSIGRRKQQPIALADILVDQDQFHSDSDLDVPNLDRMHIHIDMPDTRYLSTHHSDSLPNTCSGGPQPTAAYQDMTPFSTVTSFNFPATADATLLTPVSNAGSPPLQQRPSVKGTMRAYHQPQPSSNAQQPTPPNTSTGVYYSAYELSSSSQSPSPLTVHPHATEYNMTSYLRQSPNHVHGQPSPKDDVPPPNNPYLGHYTVSSSCNDSNVPNSFRDYADFNSVDQVDPSYITREPSNQLSQMPSNIISTSSAQTPILAPPDPLHYRMSMAPRPGDVEDLPGPNVLSIGHPGQSTYQTRLEPRRKPRGKKLSRPTPRPRVHRALSALRATEASSQDNTVDALGDGAEAVTLSDKCEEDGRFIFETRRKLVKSGMKGKGMWEEISRKYEEAYGQRLEKATLQMRLTRTFAKHAIWPEKEIEKLKAAFYAVEQKRYKLILEHMRELGGGQCWNWTAPLIEAKLIDLGFEEANIDEKTNTRKRRRIARRRRAAAAQQNPALLQGNHWSHGFGLHPGAMQAPIPEDSEDPDGMVPNYTSQQRDSYIDDVVSKMKPESEDSTSETEAMDVSYHRDQGHREQSNQQNARVAKQAVEHLMLSGMRM